MTLSKLIIASIVIFLTSCSDGYDNEGSAVYYKHWNEGSGSYKDKLNADPKTFVVLKHDRYAKDKYSVFYEGEIIKDAHAATFESIDEWYAKDKNRGYFGKYPVKSSHGQNFKVIDSYFATDGMDIFYDTIPLKVCSVKNFRHLYNADSEDEQWKWTTDGCFYYYAYYKIPSDDYSNMKIYQKSGGISKDKNWVYFLDHKLNYDVDGKKVVDTIDAPSFEVTGFLECRDKFGCFNPYHGRKSCDKK